MEWWKCEDLETFLDVFLNKQALILVFVLLTLPLLGAEPAPPALGRRGRGAGF